VIVALARLSLYIPHSHSLKEKRAVVRKLVDRMQARFKLHLAEVGGQDTWQRAVLGFALVGSDAQKLAQMTDEMLRAIESMAEGELSVEREMVRFGDDADGGSVDEGSSGRF
jgi:uncharacterized protein YlxP (DUF503 family)